MSTIDLDNALLQGDSLAVEIAAKLGPAALPVLRRYVQHENYRTRQLAMRCAGGVGTDAAAEILAAGLVDENFNVQNAAANELARKAYPSAAQTILDRLVAGAEELVREKLALAAGYLSDKRTAEVLKSVETEGGVLASNARMALARLGDVDAQQSLIAELNDPLPSKRYEGLEKLIYVDDRGYAPHVKRLLQDKAEAVRIGIVEIPRYRRVCDQAVDTLVALLRPNVSFKVSVEITYGDEALAEASKIPV
jgi:HEAT repeat protein